MLSAVAGMVSQRRHRANKMTLPTNNDFANCELSTEDLEAIAAGWPHWAHTLWHAVERPFQVAYHKPSLIGYSLLADAAIIAALA